MISCFHLTLFSGRKSTLWALSFNGSITSISRMNRTCGMKSGHKSSLSSHLYQQNIHKCKHKRGLKPNSFSTIGYSKTMRSKHSPPKMDREDTQRKSLTSKRESKKVTVIFLYAIVCCDTRETMKKNTETKEGCWSRTSYLQTNKRKKRNRKVQKRVFFWRKRISLFEMHL